MIRPHSPTGRGPGSVQVNPCPPSRAPRQSSGPRWYLGLFLLLGVLWGAADRALADPKYEGPLLYGLDPVIRSTDNPRLLGVDRLLLLRRMKSLGIDPQRTGITRPTLESSLRRVWDDRSRVDLQRRETVLEYNGLFGLMFEFRYPTFMFFFQEAVTLPGGLTYYPPRPVRDPAVQVFVDGLHEGMMRRQTVDRLQVWTDDLAVAGKGRRGGQSDGLINLTIPIKLPRTLEKIIGRGEKTRIKISGREHFALNGESTVIKPFVGNERQSNQSLFPSLDMKQELQINLSGTIGEKIIIEVDHNSEAIGPEATKIKLMYQGLEDEVIKTIETGDVGLTLPGSQLLGYSSNKSGLFGFKVTGQVGRTDFTFVTSKQKSQSSSKTFNAKGGQEEDRIINASDYLNNRFFRLDLPGEEIQGRRQGESIVYGSVKIFKWLGTGQRGEGEVAVAAYFDSLGVHAWKDIDFGNPTPLTEYGQRWQEITDFDPYLDAAGNLIAIDMGRSYQDEDALAVIYDVVDANGVVTSVGDKPGVEDPIQQLPNEIGTFYRMKLLKVPHNDSNARLFNYVLRNIYPLGGSNIDASTFDLRIEYEKPGLDQPQQDTSSGLDFFRIFGLDRENAQGELGHDGVVDFHDPYLFDLERGLLKFPLDFPTPFDADSTRYEAYADSPDFKWATSTLKENLAPQFYNYDKTIPPSRFGEYSRFHFVVRHASASSNISLGTSSIEEGSESVVVNGRTLTRGTDYSIDYTFGEIQLLGDAANLTPDSQISVNYQYAPFIGGGKTSLTGLNLGYDLGRNANMSTTWLYQSEAIVGEKAKLGEEPNHTLVGNVNLNTTLKPYLLTHVANFLSRHDSDRESSIQFSGEMAVSLPNPNTKGQAYLEDFEGVDSSNYVSLTRASWSWASVPFLGEAYQDSSLDFRTFEPEKRVTTRWFLPRDRVLRRYLNPNLIKEERDDTQQVMDLYLRADDGWESDNWGGIMRGISRTGLDLSKSQFVEIWVNDGVPDKDFRSGRLHIDFGYINEDGFWTLDEDSNLVIGNFDQEDGITYNPETGEGTAPDGIFTAALEDIGLDGLGENGPQGYNANYEIGGDSPFPRINGTARNSREDTEDLNRNARMDRNDGYFTTVIDLKNTQALIDVDYDFEDVQDLKDQNIAWRKYRIPLGAVDKVSGGSIADIRSITHARIWYENDTQDARDAVRLQLSDFKFLGSRWEREGVRRVSDEALLDDIERRGAQFFLGEVNNKENPDYAPPFPVHETNSIPEKEQALVLDFDDLQQGQLIRTSKVVSPRGDDYTFYKNLSWYFYNPSQQNVDLDLFFRVGSDSLNFYEVNYRFAKSTYKVGWQQFTVNLAELSNVKNGEIDIEGVAHGEVPDVNTGELYSARVVGRPDLRHIKRYYFGVMNQALSEGARGYFYFNDVRLLDVKKESGMAQRAGVRLNMADIIKVDFDWKHTDSEFHGLDERAGSGVDFRDWNVATNFKVDDFVPLLGFQLPVNFSRRRTVNRPKYEVNSDIEILEASTADAMSTIDSQERFSSRLRHPPSKAALARYLVDPWTLQVSGSRTTYDGPLSARRGKSLQGALNYDLRISGRHSLGDYPVLSSVPLLRGLSLVPTKVTLGANFTNRWNATTTLNEDGVVTQRSQTQSRPGVLSANLDYNPSLILDLTLTAKSDRDLLREKRAFGVNVGEENQRSYDMRMTVKTPRAKEMPDGPLFMPLRTAVRLVNKLRPSIQFNGKFVDQHGPGVRQTAGQSNVRNINNSGNWDFRFDVPLGDWVKSLFPETRVSDQRRQQLINEQRRLEKRARRQGGAPGEGQSEQDVDESGLTPEERQRREEERLLEVAQQRQQEEADQGLAEQEEAPALEEGQRLSPMILFNPFLGLLRGTAPVKISTSRQQNSSYSQLREGAPFWYQAGIENVLDAADSLYASKSYQDRKTLNLSSSSKITRSIGLDTKYTITRSLRDQVGSTTRNKQVDWPDLTLSVSGLEKWGIFGGNASDPNAGWFRSSNFNISYKKSETVNNFTETYYNPTTNKVISPRLTFNFQSGLSATANATLTSNDALSNGVLTSLRRQRIGLQLRHQFRAQRLLAKLGLYRPGNNPSVTMDVDISYQRSRTERITPGSLVSAPTGQSSFSLRPRFSYQISRSLSGAFNMGFSKSKDIATDRTTTSLGMGVEMTFVF